MQNSFNMLTGENMPDNTSAVQTQKKTPGTQLSEDLFLVYKGSRAKWEIEARDDEDFRNGAQWSKAQEKVLKGRRQMPIVVNCIHPAVEQGKALLTTHSPRFNTTGREGSDNRVAIVFNDLLSYIWDISMGNVELKTAIDDYYVKGVGYLMVYPDMTRDSGNGEVMIRSLDPYDVFVDPNSKDRLFRDAAHILYVTTLSFEQLQRMYPMYIDLINSAQPFVGENKPASKRVGPEGQVNQVTDTYHRKFRVIDRYSRVKVPNYKIIEMSDGEQRIEDADGYTKFLQSPLVAIVAQKDARVIIDDRKVQDAIEQFQQSGVFHYNQDPQTQQPVVAPGPAMGMDQNEIPNSTFQVYIEPAQTILQQFPELVTVQQVLQDAIQRHMSVGSVEIWVGVLPCEDYPIVPLVNHHLRHPYPMSDVRMVRGLQEYVNKVTSLIIAHAASSANVKVLIPRGSQNVRKLEEEFNKAGTAIVEFEADLGAPVIAQPIPLPGELYRNREDAKMDIERIFGIYNNGQGDPNSAPDTYKGTMALDEFSQRRIRSKKDDIEASLNQLGRVTIQLCQKVYQRPKIIRLVQPNNEAKISSINESTFDDLGNEIARVNDITVGRYDVQIVSGSTLPNNRWARFEYYMSLYEKGVIDQIELLKQTEVIDMKGVLERMNILKQLQQQNLGLQEQIKKLEGDLQTFERESIHDRKRLEVEKFKSQLDTMLGTLKGASQIYQSRLNDELKRQKLDNKKKTE